MKVKKLIFVLLLVIVILSAYLAISSLSGSQICLVGHAEGEPSQCDSVQNSKYGKIFGIKLPYIGFIAFLALLTLYYLSNKKGEHRENFYEIYLLFTAIGTLAALSFIYIQFFVLREICPNCLIIDSLMIIIAILSFTEFYHKRRWSSG